MNHDGSASQITKEDDEDNRLIFILFLRVLKTCSQLIYSNYCWHIEDSAEILEMQQGIHAYPSFDTYDFLK